jgi:hypothetical protein
MVEEGIQFWIREDINNGLQLFLESTDIQQPNDLQIIPSPCEPTEQTGLEIIESIIKSPNLA